MTENPTDDVLRDLEAALAVTPSREFAEGVRARIRDESARRRVWPVWTMVGLAAAAVGLAVLAWPRREPPPAAVPAIMAHASGPAASAPVVTAPSVAAMPEVTRAVARPHRPKASAPAVPTEPALVVISNQREVLQRLWARAPQTQLKEEDTSGLLMTPTSSTPIVSEAVTAPVAIAPVVVKPLGDGGDRPDQPTIRNREINAGRAR